MHLVCSHCGAINRLPEQSVVKDAKCGKCKNSIYSNKPVDLTDQSFFRYIEKNDLPIIVDFWAPWCGPCLSMAPNFAKVAEESEGLLFAKIDTQENQQISSQANIRSIPTLIFFKGGTEIDRMSGALNQNQLKQWIMQVLGKL